MDPTHENCPLTDALMNTVDALVVVADPAGRILQFNRACESVSGYSADDVVGRSLVEVLVPLEQRSEVASVLDQLLAPSTNRFENDWVTADGARRRITWSNATMTDPSGRVIAILGTGIDVTDQRRLESRLAQADRLDAIGRLASNIAHDFNNTLTSLCLRVERLAARDLDSDSEADIDAITNMIGRTQDLITELLSFSSPHRPAAARVDVNAEVRRVRAALEGLLGPDVEVDLDLTAEPAEVLIDRIGFEQAVTNLIINARDAMPAGGRLAIATVNQTVEPATVASVRVPGRLAPGDHVRLSVADTGTGIDPDDLARVFDPYFTTKPAGRGTGLGLATTYATMNQSGGTITVDSELGRGATFDIWLPLAEQESADVPARERSAEVRTDSEPCLALVVDDDIDLQHALVDELGRLGCENTITASSGEQALQHLDEPVELLVTDVQLPDIGGHELAARFRRQHPEVPIIFVSGGRAAQLSRALPHDATVLHKPFTTIDLIEAVRSIGGRWPGAGSGPSSTSGRDQAVAQPDATNR